MAEEINKTANWAPGTLDKTRKNIGELSKEDAADMAKKLGGKVMYERSGNSAVSQGKTGRIIRNAENSATAAAANAKTAQETQSETTQKRPAREELPAVSKKVAILIDKLMISPEYKIKPNYGFFNFLRNFQKNGAEKILPEFVNYSCKQMVDRLESFTATIKILIQIAPSTYKSRIANDSDAKFKFLRMVASWAIQPIKSEYANLQAANRQILTADLIPFVRAIYKPLITIYYFGSNKIPKLIKEIYADEAEYPEAPKAQLSNYAKSAITQWLSVDAEIIKKLYPVLLRICSDDFEPYPLFFNAKVGEILKFEGLRKFDLLLPEKPKEEKPETKKKPEPPKKGLKDSTVLTGLKLLDQMFPQAGFENLDEHPDLYPYFQPIFGFKDGFNLLSPENPLQTIIVLHRIIEDCFQACRNIKFAEQENEAENIQSVFNDWAAYREETFETLYCEPLCDLVNTVYSQPDFATTHIGKKTITALLWQTSYYFLPAFRFEQLVLERPVNENKRRPLFYRTDFVRHFLTLVINECDQKSKTKEECKSIENPWEPYRFTIPNEISKRLDVLLGGKNKNANTSGTNENLLKYTLCFVAVLDWYLNNPESPAYSANPMRIWRISESDGKPLFSVPERGDQNRLFADAVKENYRKNAK